MDFPQQCSFLGGVSEISLKTSLRIFLRRCFLKIASVSSYLEIASTSGNSYLNPNYRNKNSVNQIHILRNLLMNIFNILRKTRSPLHDYSNLLHVLRILQGNIHFQFCECINWSKSYVGVQAVTHLDISTVSFFNNQRLQFSSSALSIFHCSFQCSLWLTFVGETPLTADDLRPTIVVIFALLRRRKFNPIRRLFLDATELIFALALFTLRLTCRQIDIVVVTSRYAIAVPSYVTRFSVVRYLLLTMS